MKKQPLQLQWVGSYFLPPLFFPKALAPGGQQTVRLHLPRPLSVWKNIWRGVWVCMTLLELPPLIVCTPGRSHWGRCPCWLCSCYALARSTCHLKYLWWKKLCTFWVRAFSPRTESFCVSFCKLERDYSIDENSAHCPPHPTPKVSAASGTMTNSYHDPPHALYWSETGQTTWRRGLQHFVQAMAPILPFLPLRVLFYGGSRKRWKSIWWLQYWWLDVVILSQAR